MTDLTERKMTDAPEGTGSTARTVLWMILAVIGIIFLAGVIAGFVGEHRADGDREFSDFAIGLIAGVGAAIAALTTAFWRYARKLKASGEPMSRREKLNRNIILGCGILGGGIGAVMAAAGLLNAPDSASSPVSTFFDGPISVAVALSLVFVWAVLMPAISYYWHTRAIDEQEASAYRDGGYYAAYAYIILTPVWWLLWRGGLVPEPNGVAIFLIFSAIWSAVWYWKKYR